MLKWLFSALAALLFCAPSASAYSVLTHQANIDSTFDVCLVPLIKSRFGAATREEWIEAKSYAYGGAIIQDMGFYPFGSKLFTNLTHYVRSGDFVRNLLDEAHDRNEYAFALGALAHYVADIKGHPAGTNVAMASVYPDLKAKFGSAITYHEAPVQHTQLEFAFDVVQLASGRYRSADYQSFIGFQVSKPVLERAFLKTYGLELGQVLANVDLAVGSYRFAVRQLIPIAARAAWHAERDEIRKLSPGPGAATICTGKVSGNIAASMALTTRSLGLEPGCYRWWCGCCPKLAPCSLSPSNCLLLRRKSCLRKASAS
ncbi:zinc dependent phospholipase C family protein [Hymenobacter qilianensis]|uniref:Zinc dependent phospholipase C family protein n=1 Tax=Hymenobacter qilianensis TaxID=1385715 RepID=A0A7H0GW89_9BACT|nr:zinc dependent phospholipase C family protein [Hymenobacter qilianensis]QNP52555.1 zinc dependent phospholipase C family protein [Hymenobacter qilianensis]